MATKRRLGRTEIEISSVGLGCWQFSEGQGIVGGYWQALAPEIVRDIVAVSLAGGIDWFDTAEAYGDGRSERALSRALTALGKEPGDVVIATKWRPFFRTARSITATLGDRLAALAPFGIDLHQVHFPGSFSTIGAEMGALAALTAARKIRAVGVSNFSASQMRRAHAALAAHGLVLASNQVKYSLLQRRIERNGVLAAARELGITIIAYSPLAQGLLSGKFHDDPRLIASSPGPRKWMAAYRARGLTRSRPVVEELRQIARAHGVTPSRVALAWLLGAQGDTVVTIPGATRVHHAEENVGAMDLRLSATEMQRLEELSRPYLG